MDANKLKSILQRTIEVVVSAGKFIKSSFGKELDIRHKGDIDLVTEIDVAVENKLKKELRKIVDVDFLAEESASSTKLGTQPIWIVDPLDGTTNFAHSLPIVATSVALWWEGEVVLGVINLPIIGEVFSAYKGGGAYLNSKKITVSREKELKNSLIATGFPYNIKDKIDEVIPPIKSVLISCQGLRRMGAAAIDLAYVACGRFEGFFEQGLKPWDIAAGLLIVKEAGGMVTDYFENPISLYSPNILASNGIIHSQLSNLIVNSKK
ncbi:inositol monophosphatase family protein [Desulfothermus naphthae]